MLAIIVGVLLIIGGIAWTVLAMSGAGMASRQPTKMEQYGPPAIGVLAALLGVIILAWG